MIANKAHQTTSLAWILRRKPYRDNSLLIDLFTLEQGNITCVAKYSQKQANRLRGLLEPMRLLETTWSGRGKVFSLIRAEEQQRYTLKGKALVQATYATEILLRGSWQGQPMPSLFSAYQQLLHVLLSSDSVQALMCFELQCLEEYGYPFGMKVDDLNQQAFVPEQNYLYHPQQGVMPALMSQRFKVPMIPLSGRLLLHLAQDPYLESLPLSADLLLECRQVLDKLLALHLNGKTLYARQLLT